MSDVIKTNKKPSVDSRESLDNIGQEEGEVTGESRRYECWDCYAINTVPNHWTYFICGRCYATCWI